MGAHPLAGQPAPRELLVNVPRLISAYYTHKPDARLPEQQVAFGTSGHRGSSLQTSFNEGHILAICQAICEYRAAQHIDGPLYLGMDTHALSEPALASAIEVFAANGVELFVQAGLGYTPTPAVSHAILSYNRGRMTGLADGVVITPSHNPPVDGGFKYNPPSGGPADTTITTWVQDRANQLLLDDLRAVRRIPPRPRPDRRYHTPARLHRPLRRRPRRGTISSSASSAMSTGTSASAAAPCSAHHSSPAAWTRSKT